MAGVVSDTKRHYFSNGTEGYGWQSRWCDRCANDHGMHNGNMGEPQCPHIMDLLFGNDNGVFLGDNFTEPMTCIDFTRCTCDRGPDDPPGEKPPPPIDPNQGALFDITEVAMGVPAVVYADMFPMVTAVTS